MCSSILHIVYVVVLAAGAVMTLVSVATPGWKEFHNQTSMVESAKDVKSYKMALGLFQGSCGGQQDWVACKAYFENAPSWQKGAMACLILALLACVAAFGWSIVACFMCCCRSCLTPPLPILAGVACLLDVIGVAIYGAKSPDSLGDLPQSWQTLQTKGTFGYSFWVGVGACITLFIDTIVGICLVTTSKVSPV